MIVAHTEVVLAVMSTGGLQGAHHIDMAGTTLLPQGDLLLVEGQEGIVLCHLCILLIVGTEIMVITDEADKIWCSYKDMDSKLCYFDGMENG